MESRGCRIFFHELCGTRSGVLKFGVKRLLALVYWFHGGSRSPGGLLWVSSRSPTGLDRPEAPICTSLPRWLTMP